MTFSSFVVKSKNVFGPRRLDRIRVLVPCFHPLGLLGGRWWQGFFPGPSQRIPQLGFSTVWNDFLRFGGAPRPPIGPIFVICPRTFFEVKQVIDLGELWGNFGLGPAVGGGACLNLQILRFWQLI